MKRGGGGRDAGKSQQHEAKQAMAGGISGEDAQVKSGGRWESE
jgi:hypothetical protein